MTSVIVIPVFFLSFINHQEPRFLLPITLPIVLLYAPKLQTGFSAINPFSTKNRLTNWIYRKILCQKASAEVIMKIWYGSNIFLSLFYGFLHQGGVVQLNQHFATSQILDKNVYTHLVTSHIYKVPMSFFFLPSSKTLITNPNTGQKYRRSKQIFLYEYEEMNMDNLYRNLKLIIDANEMNMHQRKERHQLLLAIPTSLSNDLSLAFLRSNNTMIKHSLLKVYYPHLSTEAMPQIFTPHPVTINMDVFDVDEKCGLYDKEDVYEDESMLSLSFVLRKVSSIAHQLGLALYKIEVRRKKSQKA